MPSKKEVRRLFNEAVLERDGHRCVKCGSIAKLNVHHIRDRHDMPGGGYVKENGISLCEDSCHLKAEQWHISGGKEAPPGFSPNELYDEIGSSYAKAIKASLEALG